MIKLIITLPDGSILPAMPTELLDHRITIGSGVDNALVVPHDSVAEKHVELLLDSEGYLVADLVGNGATKINGHPVETGLYYQLETGTTIQMGEVEAVYIAADGVEEGVYHGDPAHGEVHDAAAEEEHSSGPVPATASAVAVASPKAVVTGNYPAGGYPMPKHPPGVFVPRKASRSAWVVFSLVITFAAVAAAVAVGYISTTVSVPF